MKITIETEECKVTHEEDVVMCDDFISAFAGLLGAVSFHHSTVLECMADYVRTQQEIAEGNEKLNRILDNFKDDLEALDKIKVEEETP